MSVVTQNGTSAPVAHTVSAGMPAPFHPLPSWSHCIPTLDRIDILERAVRLSLAQSHPPTEIIIVDSGNNYALNRARIEAVLAASPQPAPELQYVQGRMRSITVQREQAAAIASGEVLFFFDDDTLMFPDCAAALLSVYAADRQNRIAAAGASHVPALPDAGAGDIARKDSARNQDRARSALAQTLGRWIWSEVFMMNAARHFIFYDRPRRHGSAADVAALGIDGLYHLPLIAGYAMTVRREVARLEPFDTTLLSYAPAEDLDASYRFSRHGLTVGVTGAHVHHFEAASGRIRRRQAITLGLMNVASFVARRSVNRPADIVAYYIMFLRRLFAEFCKDLLSRRFTFPQFLGACSALPRSIAVFRFQGDDFAGWYGDKQRDVLGQPSSTKGA